MARRLRLNPAPTPTSAPIPAGRAPSNAASDVSHAKHAPPAPQGIPRPAAPGLAAGAPRVLSEARARAKGRLLQSVPLHRIEDDHLRRDRLAPGNPETDEDMAALVASIRERGQQAPIEAVPLHSRPREAWGLISGQRRLAALRHLHAETRDDRFATALVRVVHPEDRAAAYRSMVEENEIRVDVSFWERGRMVARAVEAGVFPDRRAALRGLYGSVPRAKRSKIGSFADLATALEGVLRFPTALPERHGLALAKAVEADAGLAERIAAALAEAAPEDAGAERMVVEAVLRAGGSGPAEGRRAAPFRLVRRGGRLTIAGPRVDAALEDALRDWLAARASGR